MEGEGDHTLTTVTEAQRKGLRNAGIAALVFVAIIVACCIPADSFFRNDTGELLATGQFTFFCIRQDPPIPRGQRKNGTDL